MPHKRAAAEEKEIIFFQVTKLINLSNLVQRYVQASVLLVVQFVVRAAQDEVRLGTEKEQVAGKDAVGELVVEDSTAAAVAADSNLVADWFVAGHYKAGFDQDTDQDTEQEAERSRDIVAL